MNFLLNFLIIIASLVPIKAIKGKLSVIDLSLPQPVYGDYFIAMYNIFYTSQPVVMMAVLDQDVNADMAITYNKLYEPGIRNMFFNRTKFAVSAWQGLWTSFALVAIGLGNVTA